MSKYPTKPSGEDEKTSSSQAADPTTESPDLSERSLRKRSRQGTPQSSPPRLVSVEELMQTAKGVTNMALAHEIVLNGGFQIKPSQPAEGSLEKRVKDIMHRAFWDCLEAQLKEEPPIYDHAVKLLGEIKETLLSFLLPGHRRLRNQIEEALDLGLIQQQAENGALDINKLADFIISMMGMLCAPSRDEEIKKLRDISGVVPLFRAMFNVLDLMKIDMANFAVSSIRPHLMQQSVEYERRKFQEFIEKQPNALDFTRKWLRDTASALLSTELGGGTFGQGAATPHPSALHPLTLHNHAYLHLLRWDHASDPFPETLVMDQSRFQEMQLELERLSVEAAVLLIVYNSAGAALAGLPDLMGRLKGVIMVLLAGATHTPSFNAKEAFASLAEKMCAEVGSCLDQHGFSPFPADHQAALKGQISAVQFPDNSVRKLIDSRIQTYLLGFLESTQRCVPSLPAGLAPIQKELEMLAVKLTRLVNYNKMVFAPHYQTVLQDILEEDTRTGPETSTGQG